MIKYSISILIVVFTFSLAWAEWLVSFEDTYNKEGIDDAVVVAMNEGANPEMIIEKGLSLDGLNPRNLVKALFCAGAEGKDIRDASKKWEISDIVVAAGYKKSVAECGVMVADAQAYTPIGPSFARPSNCCGGKTISQSNF